MATLPFLSGSTGDPKAIKVRFAFQENNDVPAAEASFVDGYVFGNPFAPSRSTIDPQAIEGSGAPLLRLPGKKVSPARAFPFGDLDPTNLLQLMGWMAIFGKYTHTDKTGWHEWQMSLEEATAVTQQLSVLSDTNVTPRSRWIGYRLGGVTLNVAANGNVSMESNGAPEQYDLFAVPTQTVGTGSTLPVYLGIGRDQGSDISEHYTNPGVNIKTKVTAVALPNVTIQNAIGAGAYSTSQTVTVNRPNDQFLLDESGDLIGPPGDPMRIFWPTGATLVALDEFTVGPRRAAWTQTGLTRFAIPSVNTRWILDGELTRVEGGYSVTVEQALDVSTDVYGEQRQTITPSGPLRVRVTPTRRTRDLTFQRILHEAEEISLVIDGRTSTLISAGPPGIPYRSIFIMPALNAEGDQYSVDAGAENRDESLTLTAGVPASAFTYSPGMGVADYSVSTHAAAIFWNNHAAIAGKS